jgi:hypothetical protein
MCVTLISTLQRARRRPLDPLQSGCLDDHEHRAWLSRKGLIRWLAGLCGVWWRLGLGNSGPGGAQYYSSLTKLDASFRISCRGERQAFDEMPAKCP